MTEINRLKCKLAAAKAILYEAANDHANPESVSYIECDIKPCWFCEQVRDLFKDDLKEGEL